LGQPLKALLVVSLLRLDFDDLVQCFHVVIWVDVDFAKPFNVLVFDARNQGYLKMRGIFFDFENLICKFKSYFRIFLEVLKLKLKTYLSFK
jgi:hypothetical protein